MIAQRPIVLCGLGELGILTLERLLAFGERVVVVDPRPPEAFAMRCQAAGVRVVVGSGRDPAVLREAGLAEAKALLALASDDMVNLGIALAAEEQAPGIRLVVRLFNERLAQKLARELPHCRVLDVSAVAAPIFAFAGLHADIQHVVDVPGGNARLDREMRGWLDGAGVVEAADRQVHALAAQVGVHANAGRGQLRHDAPCVILA